MKKLISIVTPAYNEELVLDELKKRLQRMSAKQPKYDFEFIIVENGSWDNSYQKLLKFNKEDDRFKILQLSRNFGCDGGITAGLKYAKGDAAVIMNADLQDPPELIHDFIKRWEKGYDIVYGLIEKRKGVSFIRSVLSSSFYLVINKLTHNMVPKNASDFRLMDRKVYSVVNQMEERNRFLRGVVAWTGFRQIGIPFKRPPRFAGKPKANFFAALSVAINGVFSFSYFPLKLATWMGFLIFILSFLLFFYEFGLYLVFGKEVPGFFTIILAVSFLFGMLFLLLGIMGIYISRIYDEVKQRPNFIVSNEIGFSR
ncbi:MAG: glycosyltransferase family 2 protein [Candidatus Woesearchaeota archaeon]|nr:glycosyltransferase family 2 protein [Candidatus Woesearchaeota archaeon]